MEALSDGRVRVKVTLTLHHLALTPVMPMNKGIEPMGEGVRVKTATTLFVRNISVIKNEK
mgnify:CR=1 FL=1